MSDTVEVTDVTGRPEVGDIIQISPGFTVNTAFAGCLAVVEEVKEWGVTAYVTGLSGGGVVAFEGKAYIRLAWSDFELTGGTAVWRGE